MREIQHDVIFPGVQTLSLHSWVAIVPRRKMYPARVETALSREDAAWVLLESRARKVTISEFIRFLVVHYRAYSPAAQRDLFAALDEESRA